MEHRTTHRTMRKLLLAGAFGVVLAAMSASPALSQNYAPAIDQTSLLNMRFFDSGLFRFDDATVAFAPAGQVDVQAEVTDANGKSIAKFDHFPDYVYTATTFGRIRVKGPADVNITEPGKYQIQYIINGKPSTRLPFTVKVEGSGDPFNPAKKYQFDGPWRSLAYIWMRPYKNTTIPDVVFWTGKPDLKAGTTKDQTIAKLFFNGKMIAHSNRAQGHITSEHYKQSTHTFLAPHEARRAHEAPPFTREKLANGNYNIRVERQSDGALLRNFAFTVAGGQIQPIKRAVLGYQPHEDFVVPRVPVFGSSTYEFKQAIWINDPNR